jgi:hypothetical protein
MMKYSFLKEPEEVVNANKVLLEEREVWKMLALPRALKHSLQLLAKLPFESGSFLEGLRSL